MDPVEKTDAQWKQELTPEQYKVLREGETEAAGTGEYYHNTKTGHYLCGACGTELFSSDAKYDSGSGWPSFYQPVAAEALQMKEDTSHGMHRTEITCGKCGSHLGHVFNDGPKPTGERYCVNSLSLTFQENEDSTS